MEIHNLLDVKSRTECRLTVFTIDKDILQKPQSDPVVWNNFCQFPDLYKRIRIDAIQIKKNQPELFESRLNKFIENTRKGLLYGEWNDNGRL